MKKSGEQIDQLWISSLGVERTLEKCKKKNYGFIMDEEYQQDIF
jgi:hypothetical protein